MRESVKRLKFLEVILENSAVSKSELASIMGVSPQNIFTYFKRDDMKLSLAQEMASRLGYSLSFSLEGEKASSENVILDIESFIGEKGLNRLAFLRAAMGLYQIERKKLAEQLGIGYTGLNRWFKVDDIAISYIFKIAELYGLKVHVKATKKQESPSTIEIE